MAGFTIARAEETYANAQSNILALILLNLSLETFKPTTTV